MRSVWRTLGAGPVRDIVTVLIAACFVGVSYGAIAIAAGMPAWAVVAFSVFVFAGGSQFLAVALAAAGNPVAAVLGGLLLNARHLPFGLTVADAVGSSAGPVGWSAATSWSTRRSHSPSPSRTPLAAEPPTGSPGWHLRILADRHACWASGSAPLVNDPAAYGLDAAFPAALLAADCPPARGRRPAGLVDWSRPAVAVSGHDTCLPAGLPVLLRLLGVSSRSAAPPAPGSPSAARRGGPLRAALSGRSARGRPPRVRRRARRRDARRRAASTPFAGSPERLLAATAAPGPDRVQPADAPAGDRAHLLAALAPRTAALTEAGSVRRDRPARRACWSGAGRRAPGAVRRGGVVRRAALASGGRRHRDGWRRPDGRLRPGRLPRPAGRGIRIRRKVMPRRMRVVVQLADLLLALREALLPQLLDLPGEQVAVDDRRDRQRDPEQVRGQAHLVAAWRGRSRPARPARRRRTRCRRSAGGRRRRGPAPAPAPGRAGA